MSILLARGELIDPAVELLGKIDFQHAIGSKGRETRSVPILLSAILPMMGKVVGGIVGCANGADFELLERSRGE